jgi:hypothetical protein
MSDSELKKLPKQVPLSKGQLLLQGLPDYLKDPANYMKIQKAILDAGATKHSHSEMILWAECKSCQKKQWDRKETMHHLGFKSGAQYLAWKKIMDTMIDVTKRVKLRL